MRISVAWSTIPTAAWAAREIDNAAAESLNSLYKHELIDPKEDWQGLMM
jgi:hypothetical protein